MNLYHLRYFVQLAHTRHYTRAAEQLCITQPSLSHAISQLENELGLPLFEKTGRNTELTRFGEQFLECAERTLSTLDEGVEELKRVSRGEGLIRLGCCVLWVWTMSRTWCRASWRRTPVRKYASLLRRE